MTATDAFALFVACGLLLVAVGAVVRMMVWATLPVEPSVRRLQAYLRRATRGGAAPHRPWLYPALSEHMISAVASAEGFELVYERTGKHFRQIDQQPTGLNDV